MNKLGRSVVFGCLAALMLGISSSARAADPVLFVMTPGCCGGGPFTIQTLSGAVVNSAPVPPGAEPLTFAAAANDSIVYDDSSQGAGAAAGPVWLTRPNAVAVELDPSPADFDASISYDGSTVTFARLDPATGASDIYTIRADGSDLTLVASGRGDNYLASPKFSPDGGSIAYSCIGAQVAAAPGLGCGPLLDGSYQDAGILLMNVDGSDKRMILAAVNAEGSGYEFSWSPDGKWLATTGCVPVGNDPQSCVSQVLAFRTDGSDLFNFSRFDVTHAITHQTMDQGPSYPEFSPDGTQIMFMNGHDDAGHVGNFFYAISRDGTNEHELFSVPAQHPEVVPPATGGRPSPTVNATPPSVSGVGDVVMPSWIDRCSGFIVETFARSAVSCIPIPTGMGDGGYSSAANGSIVFSDALHAYPGGAGGGPVWLIGAGKPPIELDSSPYDENPSISYDGSRIAFDRFDPNSGSSGIYVVNSDGSGRNLVVSGGTSKLLSPALSPDGGTIAYITDGGVRLVKVDGSEKRQILSGSGSTGPMSWSRDGRFLAMDSCVPIVVRTSQTCVNAVFAYHTDGSDLYDEFDPSRQVTHEVDPWGPLDPQFSPDGTRILYLKVIDDSGREGDFTYLINRDGTNREEVFLSAFPFACVAGICSGNSQLGLFVPLRTGGGPSTFVKPTRVTVPTVRTLSYSAAKNRLAKVHLVARVSRRVYSSRIRRGRVVTQYPYARAHARLRKRHRSAVKLVLSRGRRPKR